VVGSAPLLVPWEREVLLLLSDPGKGRTELVVKYKAQVETYDILWLPRGRAPEHREPRPASPCHPATAGAENRSAGTWLGGAAGANVPRRSGHRLWPPGLRDHSMGGAEPEPGMRLER
jgi:hypothetical protein